MKKSFPGRSGSRWTRAARMAAEGHGFFRADNGFRLTGRVPAERGKKA